jgi:MFS family permease
MITPMPHAVAGDDALNRRPVVFAVAVATAGVLPAFLTGGLAVQVRGELDFGAAATGITQTGASGGAALGPLVFGLVVEAASYEVAWLVSGAIALAALAAIIAGRRMLLRDYRPAPENGPSKVPWEESLGG